MSSFYEQYQNLLELSCDHCHRKTETYLGESFQIAFSKAKADGWIAYKDSDTDEWCYKCPECNKNA